MIRNEQMTPVISVALCEEYQDVLGRPPLAKQFTEKEKNASIDFLCSVAYLPEIFFLWRPVLRDPKDDLILEAAVASECKTIITHNLKHFKGTEAFGIESLTPKHFLERRRS